MRVIYKYLLEFTGDQVIENVGPTAKILHVASQSSDLYLWIERDVEQRQEESGRRILIAGTGIEFDSSGMTYIGTAHHNGLVLHVYDGGIA